MHRDLRAQHDVEGGAGGVQEEHILGLRTGTNSPVVEDEAEVALRVVADEEVVGEVMAQTTAVDDRRQTRARHLWL